MDLTIGRKTKWLLAALALGSAAAPIAAAGSKPASAIAPVSPDERARYAAIMTQMSDQKWADAKTAILWRASAARRACPNCRRRAS
jgi:soluble lytic murein transglycosylase